MNRNGRESVKRVPQPCKHGIKGFLSFLTIWCGERERLPGYNDFSHGHGESQLEL
jgi:hypothetical protein